MKNKSLSLAEKSSFRDLAGLVTSDKSFISKVKTIISVLEDAVKISGKLLYLTKSSENKLISFSFGGGKKRELPHGTTEGIASVVRDTHKVAILDNARENPKYSIRVDIPLRKSDKALAVIPLTMDKRLVGILELAAKSFSNHEINLITSITDYLAIACAHALDLDRIKELTITDELTGLYNASHLNRLVEMEIRRAERYRGVFSLIFIDIDNFKAVNDKYGHLVGSRILQEVGKLLADSLRDDIDTAHRYGGDEFVIFLPSTDRKGATVVAKRLQYLIKFRTFRDDKGVTFNITGSFGIASFPDDAQSRKEIIRIADESMYKVKNTGRDGIGGGMKGNSAD